MAQSNGLFSSRERESPAESFLKFRQNREFPAGAAWWNTCGACWKIAFPGLGLREKVFRTQAGRPGRGAHVMRSRVPAAVLWARCRKQGGTAEVISSLQF